MLMATLGIVLLMGALCAHFFDLWWKHRQDPEVEHTRPVGSADLGEQLDAYLRSRR